MYIYITQILEVTSIRSGLRKRKRPESPQSTEPQVTEEWVDEDKLELWEIKQYGERYTKKKLGIINITCLMIIKYLHVIQMFVKIINIYIYEILF